MLSDYGMRRIVPQNRIAGLRILMRPLISEQASKKQKKTDKERTKNCLGSG